LNWHTAIKFPFLVARKTKLSNLKGTVNIVSDEIKTGMIQIGLGDVPVFDRVKSRTVWNNVGTVIFKGSACIGHGSKIGCGGTLTFGNNFQITAESMIICDHEINFGDDVLLSWQIQIMDTDFHKVYHNDTRQNKKSAITIGNHTWIGSRSIINKGVTLGNNTIVAAGTVVTKSFTESNSMIGGVPAKIIRNNTTWEMK